MAGCGDDPDEDADADRDRDEDGPAGITKAEEDRLPIMLDASLETGMFVLFVGVIAC